MIGKIYLIENQINHKKYVGQTSSTIEKRWKEHCRDALKEYCKNRPLYRAIAKYGVDNFTITLLEETDNPNEREQYWIEFYNSFHYGYNATLGGEGKPIYDYDIFVQEYQQGMQVCEIANRYQCDPGTVSKALQIAGLTGITNRVKKRMHPVYQFTLDGKLIQKFESQAAAAQYLLENNIASGNKTSIVTNIGRVAKKQRQMSYGYVWRYNNEF